jgi:predicted Zn-dependent peptidase
MHRKRTFAAVLLAVALAGLPAAAVDIAYFESKVTTATLDNGLTIVIYERPTAPVVSFFTYVDVGSAQEVPGITGLAHMFEHMAFKGTGSIGTKDYEAEKKAIAKEDAAYAAYAAARDRLEDFDPEEVERLKRAFEAARDEAQAFVARDEFSEIVDRAGGVGLNAFTGADSTSFVMSLPANKAELWAYLESERFLDPVFREFYQERGVVQEERRMRVESQPIGRLLEQFLTTAFQAHPYGQPTVGHMSDLESFTRPDARKFYETYYGPSNLTVGIAGDVTAAEIMPMLKRYLGRLKARPAPPPLRTVEPAQVAEKTVILTDPSQPVYMEGYHRPSARHPDDAVYDAISDVLSSGRTSRLYRRLVRDDKIAAFAAAFNGYPGTKYPHLMIFFAMPTPGHTNEEVQGAIRSEIERLKSEPVSDEELSMVKTRAKAGLIRSLRSNSGIAGQLAAYQARYGDWRELFRSVERIEKVTKEDIMRVAKATFVPTNRTVAMIVNDDTDSE